MLVDRRTGRPITEPDFQIAAGPAASERTRRRLADIRGRRVAGGPAEPDEAHPREPGERP